MRTWLDQARPAKLVPRALSSQPWYLIFYVTSHCNQRCNMCFAWEMLNSLKRSEEWQLPEIERVAAQFPKLYQVSLTGGEPTLRADLAEIIEIFYRVSGVQRVTIPTNGFYPDRIERLVRRVMESCPGLVLSINMSLDGIGEVHDKIRGLKDSFKNLVETYRRVQSLRKIYPNLHSATASVVTESNRDSIKELLYWVRDNMDISNHGMMLARGDVKSEEGKATSKEFFIEMLALHRELSRFGNRLRDAVADEYTQSRIDTLKTERMKDPCLAGKKLIIIDERGNVLPCEILKVLAEKGETDAPELGNFSFGNLRDVDFDLSALLESERGRAIRKFIEDERCWCTFECAQINNFVLNPQAYLRTIVRAVTNSPVEP
jgi:MoaA/NifB/PqqE/SkfB family radical SAM enzyme